MKPDFERTKSYILRRLADELAPELSYHSLQHTRDDVLPAAIRLGSETGLSEEDMLLLSTAALYHDAGFLNQYHNHEDESIAIARSTLPEFGYDLNQIRIIAGMIAATRMPQTPTTLLEELICDADLDVLGRDDFWPRNRDLLAEIRLFVNGAITDKDWLLDQTRFLETHIYFSPAAHALRDRGKSLNLDQLHQALASLNGDGKT